MENISEVLISKIKNLTELEIVGLEINSAIYLKKVDIKLKECMEEISKNIDNQIKLYGQKTEDYSEYKNNILDKYNSQFIKVIEEYQTQYVNIINEIGEAQANQKVSIANCKKLKNMREEFLDSEDYKKFIQLKQRYKQQMDDSLTKIDFDRNYQKYHNLKNPVDDYNIKIKASAEKAKKFEEIIDIARKKQNDCLEETISQLDKLVSRKTRQIQTLKNNIFSKIINKLKNLFSGKKKLKMFVIDKSEEEIVQLEKDVVETIENTREDTISFIEKVLMLRENLNREFISAIKV